MALTLTREEERFQRTSREIGRRPVHAWSQWDMAGRVCVWVEVLWKGGADGMLKMGETSQSDLCLRKTSRVEDVAQQ